MTNWPVLYPFLLSLSAFIYTPALHWALLLNCVAFITIAGMLFRDKRQNSLFLVLIFSLLLSFPFLKLQVHALSEPIFLCLLFAVYIQLKAYYENQQNRYLIIAACLASLLCLQRYIGIYLCISVAFILWIQTKKIVSALPFFISVIPAAINLYISSLEPQNFSALERSGSLQRFSFFYTNLYTYFSAQFLAATIIVLLPVILSVAVLIRKPSRFHVLLFTTFIVYQLVPLSSFPISLEEYVRYLLIFTPILLTADASVPPRLLKPTRTFTTVLFCIVVVLYPFTIYDIYHNGTGGYNKLKWVNPNLNVYIEKNSSFVLSNAPDYLYFSGGLRSDYLSTDQTTLNQQLKTARKIIWVDGIREGYMNQVKIILDSSSFQKETHIGFNVYSRQNNK